MYNDITLGIVRNILYCGAGFVTGSSSRWKVVKVKVPVRTLCMHLTHVGDIQTLGSLRGAVVSSTASIRDFADDSSYVFMGRIQRTAVCYGMSGCELKTNPKP